MNKKNLVELLQKGRLWIASLLVAALLFSSWSDKKPVLKNGTWTAELQRADGPRIVFNFETKDSAGRKILYVINGEERLLVIFGRA